MNNTCNPLISLVGRVRIELTTNGLKVSRFKLL